MFEAHAGNITEAFSEIGLEEIEYCCAEPVLYRGEQYHDKGHVKDVTVDKKNNRIKTNVQGQSLYSVGFYVEGGEVQGDCNCPYGGVCKHIVAALFEIMEVGPVNLPEDNIGLTPSTEGVKLVQNHLNGLSKEELVNLVLRYAPDQYFTEIINKNTGQNEALNLFYQVKKRVTDFFNDDEMLWNPLGMEGAILGQLEQLSGLEQQIPEQIGDLIIQIMLDVNRAMDEGYLYIDNYYEEEYFESDDIDNFILQYIKSLEFNKKLNYLNALDKVFLQMNYSIFEAIPEQFDKCFNETEINDLSLFILKNAKVLNTGLLSSLFPLVKDRLKPEDLEYLLEIMNKVTSFHFHELIQVKLNREKYKEAFMLLDEYLDNENSFAKAELIRDYLKLALQLNVDYATSAMKALKVHPTHHILLMIKKLKPIDTEEFEQYLQDKNLRELIIFLEKEQRIDEAYALVHKRGSRECLFDFLKKHKKRYPEKAEKVFLARIDDNLKSAGESFYYAIVHTLKELRQINPSLTREVVEDIKVNYKRRRNLMTLLEKL